jgi:hypothetical protein
MAMVRNFMSIWQILRKGNLYLSNKLFPNENTGKGKVVPVLN